VVPVFREKLCDIRSNVSITTHICTDLQTKSFLGINVHFVEDTRINFICLGMEELDQSHRADYIGNQILKTLVEWNIKDEKFVVTSPYIKIHTPARKHSKQSRHR
jgi:hypothetical protein